MYYIYTTFTSILIFHFIRKLSLTNLFLNSISLFLYLNLYLKDSLCKTIKLLTFTLFFEVLYKLVNVVLGQLLSFIAGKTACISFMKTDIFIFNKGEKRISNVSYRI